MTAISLNLLLADNDLDDCMLFNEALKELEFAGTLTTVNDGEQLMNYLVASQNMLPDVLFLDLNMPRKNGFECLVEIMHNKDLKHVPVIIFSTSFVPGMIDRLFNDGAKYYIQKPAAFSSLKHVIEKAIYLTQESAPGKPVKETFVLHPC